MLEIKSGFTCSQLNVHGNTVTWKNSMSLNFLYVKLKHLGEGYIVVV